MTGPCGPSYSNKDNSIVQSLPGKFIRNAKQSLPGNDSRPSEVLYIDPSATISGSVGDSGSSRYGVYISANGAKIATAYLNPIVGDWEYIYDANRNAYPDSGISGNYEYQYLGFPFENAVNPVKIATGTYTGTGTYGSSNPNRMTFDFEPKMLFIYSKTSFYPTSYGFSSGFLWGEGMTKAGGNATYILNFDLDGNTISWYSEKSALNQCNSTSEWRYFAIG